MLVARSYTTVAAAASRRVGLATTPCVFLERDSFTCFAQVEREKHRNLKLQNRYKEGPHLLGDCRCRSIYSRVLPFHFRWYSCGRFSKPASPFRRSRCCRSRLMTSCSDRSPPTRVAKKADKVTSVCGTNWLSHAG